MAVRLPRLLDSGMKEIARLNPVSLSIEENLSPLSTAEMVLPISQLTVLVDPTAAVAWVPRAPTMAVSA